VYSILLHEELEIPANLGLPPTLYLSSISMVGVNQGLTAAIKVIFSLRSALASPKLEFVGNYL